MAFDFPNSPTEGQTFTPSGGPTYVFHSPAWELLPGASGNSVLYTAQSLTAAQQEQARSNISAAPFSALAYNNIIINGSFDVSQQYGFGVSADWINYTSYVVDQWKTSITVLTPGSSVFDEGIVTPPGTPPWRFAYNNCFQMRITTASNAFAGANDYALLYQYIEGARFQKLGFGYSTATPVTLGFWIYANKTGTFGVTLGSGSSSRGYIHNFTINAANTWEYKTYTFPPDTGGDVTHWPTGNTRGAWLQFCFAAGSSQKTMTPDTWVTSLSVNATSLQTNFFDTINFSVYLTGVCLLPGSVAPSAEQSVLTRRPLGEEFELCARYYLQGTWVFNETTYLQASFFPTPMRGAPTMSGGGAGFGVSFSTTISMSVYQSALGTGVIKADARM